MEESNSNQNKDYCEKCGSPIDKDTLFCQKCGAPVKSKSQITYVKSSGVGNGWKAVAIIMGGLLILVSIPFLFGGGALMGVTDWLDQGDGYIGVNNINLATDTQFLIGKEMDINMNDLDSPSNLMWEPDMSDIITIKVKAESNTGDDVFIGIIDANDAYSVFGNAAYDQVTKFNMDDPRDRHPYIEYRYHSGQTLNITPTDLDVWTAEATGSGEQTLVWTPEPGNYWLVVMNADASPDVNIDLGAGVRIPILNYVGRGLFVGGLVLLAVGVAIVYFGAIKPRN
jgi:hypothetical protein